MTPTGHTETNITPISGIWMIKNEVNGRAYFGASKYAHSAGIKQMEALNNRVHINKELQREWFFYPEHTFSFKIVLECPEKDLFKQKRFVMLDYSNKNGAKALFNKVGAIKNNIITKKIIAGQDIRTKKIPLLRGVYMIRNKYTGRTYIGMSGDVYSTKSKNYFSLDSRRFHNNLLQEEWIFFGESAFEFKVLEKCPTGNLKDRLYHHIGVLKSTYGWGASYAFMNQDKNKDWICPVFMTNLIEKARKVMAKKVKKL